MTVSANAESASTVMWAFMPKSHRLPFLDLIHFKVALAVFVLDGAGCFNQAVVNERTCVARKPLGVSNAINAQHHPGCQILVFGQMAESEQGALVEQTAVTQIQSGKLPIKLHVIYDFIHEGEDNLNLAPECERVKGTRQDKVAVTSQPVACVARSGTHKHAKAQRAPFFQQSRPSLLVSWTSRIHCRG